MYQFLATIIPSIALVYFFVSLDKFPEPKKIIIVTFILGILISIPAYFLNTYAAQLIYDNFYYTNYYDIIDIFFVGPFFEEILKFSIILFYCSKLDEFDEPMDGLVYGATAALGFAMAENFLYVYNPESYNSTWQDIAWLRAFLTAPMHAACGIFIGLLVAIIFHFLYNYGYFESIVLVQIIILFFLFKNLRKKQEILNKVWKQ